MGAGPHAYFDRVSHNGSLWLCINPEGTESEPADNNPDWLKQVAEGQRGLQGLQGPKGEQGIQGPAGADGRSSYFHIKYSHLQNPDKPTDISDTPNDYIGTYVDFSEDDSSDPAAYTWARFKGLQGAKGDQGIPVQMALTVKPLICTLNTLMMEVQHLPATMENCRVPISDSM